MNNEKIMKNLCNERDEKGRAKIQKIMNYAKQEMTEKNLEKKPLATTIKQFNIKAILREKSRKKNFTTATIELVEFQKANV